jgi:hypothetical protein
MNKTFSALITVSILLLNFSCGKEQQRTINALPPSGIDQFKEQGFVMISGNAYPSVGMIAKETDSQGKNNSVELDNPLKFNLNGKFFSYFSFIVNVKAKATDGEPDFQITKDNGSVINIPIISKPKNQEIEFMNSESLKYNGDKSSPAIFSNDVAQKLNQNEVLCWKETEKISGENIYSFLIKSDIVKSFKTGSKKTALKLKFKMNSTFQDTINLVRSPIHLAVIGDSVMWGQGMKRDDYLFSNLKKNLEEKKDNFVRMANYARSGAKFGDENNNQDIDLNGEISSDSPTINAQLKRVIEDFKPYEGNNKVEMKIDPKRIDLLVMDGGINNVGPVTIAIGFDPRKFVAKDEEVKSVLLEYDGLEKVNANFNVKDLTKKMLETITFQDSNYKNFRKLVNESFCYNEEKNDFSGCPQGDNDNNVELLLDKARKKIPNAQVNIMGYFPLLGNNSTISCSSPMTITNPANGKPVTVNMGTSAFLGLSTYMALINKTTPETAMIVGGAVSLAGKGLLGIAKNNSVKRSQFWTNHSNTILSKAVENVSKNNTNGRGVVRFLPVAHKFEKNTFFSPDPYMWGFDQGKCVRDGMYFPPEDLVWKERKEICKDLPKNALERFICERFSMFHPNVKGFNKVYLPEIEDSLKYSGFINRDDL